MQLRTETRPGWVELAHAGVHVLAKGDDHLRDRLLSAVGAAGGDALPDVLTDELAAGGVRQAPDFAIVDEPGRRVLVRGSARVVLTGPDGTSHEVVAPVRAPWVDEDLDEDATSGLLATGEPELVSQQLPAAGSTPESMAPAVAAAQTAPDAHSRPQFVDGHLVAVGTAATTHPSAPGEPEASASPDEPPSGSASSPAAGPATGILPTTYGQGPPPARLVLPTGETVTLDRGVVLGRAPKASAAIATDDPHLVRVASPDNEISRSHVEVYPDAGQVVVRDLGSTNGTTLTPPGGSARRLDPGAAHPIEPGTTIRLAGQVAVVLGED